MSKGQSNSWRPNCSPELWKQRMDLIYRVRSFFIERNYLETETPLLSQYSSTDPEIGVFETAYKFEGQESALGHKRYLLTSPEFHMKRLLCSGFPSLFQIGKAFRNGESGEYHNSEFSILEFYQLNCTAVELRLEIMDLLNALHPFGEAHEISYRDAFLTYAGLDPFKVADADLAICAAKAGLCNAEDFNRNGLLQFLLAIKVEPNLGVSAPTWLIDYPSDQAALATLKQDAYGNWVANRFELYIQGVELCNGYSELSDSSEQVKRFKSDQEIRSLKNYSPLPYDQHLIDALDQGSFDNCAGVALGLDRIFMLVLKKQAISEVMLFDDTKA